MKEERENEDCNNQVNSVNSDSVSRNSVTSKVSDSITSKVSDSVTSQDTTEQDHEIKQWIESIIQEKIATPLKESLKTGVVLCKLMNALIRVMHASNSNNSNNSNSKHVPRILFSTKPSTFLQRENITSFLAHSKCIGVEEYELFDVNDLYEAGNFGQVRVCIYALCRNVRRRMCAVKDVVNANSTNSTNANANSNGNGAPYFIGPKMADKQVITFSAQQINKGRNEESRFMSTKSVARGTFGYGARRQVWKTEKENNGNN